MSTPKAVSIYTPFNQRKFKSTLETRRVFCDGRWQKPDPQAARTLQWLRGTSETTK